MPTYKSSNITDFFKPFAQSRQSKRPPPDEDLQQFHPSRKSRSTTPQLFQSSLPIRSCENTPSKPRADDANASSPVADINASAQSKPTNPVDTLACTALVKQLVPPSSQGPNPTSSQRVTKNSEVFITNSDDEGSDTDASLGDIDELLRSRRRLPGQLSSPVKEPDVNTVAPSSDLPPEVEPDPVPDLSKGRRTRRRNGGRQPVRETFLHVPRYEFDLRSLIKRSQQDEVFEDGLTRARDLLANLERDGASAAAAENENLGGEARVDAGFIASAVREKCEENDAKRLLLAIQRTEALQEDLSWSFFDDDKEASDLEIATFPAVIRDGFHGILSEPGYRQHAFSTGAIGAIATSNHLPNEILIWLFDAGIEITDKIEIRPANTCNIDAARESTLILTCSRIDAAFMTLGANAIAVELKAPIVPIARAKSTEGRVSRRPRLESLIELLGDLAVYLDTDTRSHVINILCRLLVDHTIVRGSYGVVAVEEALNKLIDAMMEDEYDKNVGTILGVLYDSLSDVALRARLIDNIPACSLRLSLFRRRLSLAFFFDDKDYLYRPAQDLVNLSLILHRLGAPQFATDKDTNYTKLAALIAILNVGLGCSSFPQAGLDQMAETAFNEKVDELSSMVRSISTSIIDTGASQLKKTEAKEILECLNFRLMYAVRTVPKPKNNKFMNRKIQDFLDYRQTKKAQATMSVAVGESAAVNA